MALDEDNMVLMKDYEPQAHAIYEDPTVNACEPTTSNRVESIEAQGYVHTIHHLTPVSSHFGPGFESEAESDNGTMDDVIGSHRGLCAHPARNYDAVNVDKINIGFMAIMCKDCKALHFPGEVKSRCSIDSMTATFTQCCAKGEVVLPTLQKPPVLIEHLFNNKHVLSSHFLQNIRQYNSSLAFASMVAKTVDFSSRGPYSYKIHGQIYHNVGPLESENVMDSNYAQLYVLDSDLATKIRMERNQMKLMPQLLKELSDIITTVNVYAKSYQMMQNVIAQQSGTSEVPEVYMIFDEKKNSGSRRHNAPAPHEIAAVFVSESGDVPTNRGVVVKQKDNRLRNMSVLSPFCEPMTYPLFYCRGELGWSPELKLRKLNAASKKQQQRMSMLKYYAYRLAFRSESLLHLGGKLFQQYVVDAYCKIQENNLNYVRTHQADLRSECYKGLMDHLANEASEQRVTVGRRVILPSTFSGSPRNMSQNYFDAMTIVAKLGRPDLFITFTCNPNWSEIKSELLPGQAVSDRPDLTARVFKLKLDCLFDDLLKKHVFGKIIGYVSVIEFQKRGLPHCHILLTLSAEDKPRTSNDIDSMVAAEIPDSDDPVLREIVLRHMIHGPCGEHNPQSPCMKDGRCIHNYPKCYADQSHYNQKGLSVYRRPTGNRASVGRHSVGNEWVVPYNKWLTKRYEAHINVEICSSVKSVKYLHKYIYKGHDSASLRFAVREHDNVLNYDEVQQFLETRYVGAPEACWRIFQFKMQDKSHTIVRLPVHEDQQQTVVFQQGKENEALERATDRNSKLTAYFALNKAWSGMPVDFNNVSDPRNYHYSDIVHHYVFDREKNSWKPRKQSSNEIGRMYFVAPTYVERFHLRLLLLNKKGATSFSSLKTVNGIEYSTFVEACQAMGIARFDAEFDLTMDETSRSYPPYQVRQTFANILGLSSPSDPNALWQKYKQFMAEDFVQRGIEPTQAEATAYEKIKELTSKLNYDIESVIPKPEASPACLCEDLEESISMNSRAKGAELYAILNNDQRNAADMILTAIDSKSSERSFFVDGPGGSGKTFLYVTLYHLLKGRGKKVLNVAWSGIAAQLLPDGRTAHSAFSLPVPVTRDNFVPTMKVNSIQAEELRKIDVIIWDEAPMTPKYAVEGVNILLQDVMGNKDLFGGKTLLLGGDFRQIPPIVKEKHESAVLEATLKRSFLWRSIKKYKLSVNMRARGCDDSFAQFLLDVGDGKAKVNDDGLLAIPDHLRSGGDLVKEIYNSDLSCMTPQDIASRSILSIKNSDCDQINDKVLKLLPSATASYLSVDEAVVDEFDSTSYTTEYLNSLTPSGMPKHELKLKVGAIVMLLRNLNVSKGLCNGTRMVVQRMNSYTIECKTIETGEVVVLPRIDMTPCDANFPFTLKRRQFPIKLCFAMTVNKSQGQSFSKVGVYLPSPPLSHGHLYVALSRCRSPDGLKILVAGNSVPNIILKELLV